MIVKILFITAGETQCRKKPTDDFSNVVGHNAIFSVLS